MPPRVVAAALEQLSSAGKELPSVVVARVRLRTLAACVEDTAPDTASAALEAVHALNRIADDAGSRAALPPGAADALRAPQDVCAALAALAVRSATVRGRENAGNQPTPHLSGREAPAAEDLGERSPPLKMMMREFIARAERALGPTFLASVDSDVRTGRCQPPWTNSAPPLRLRNLRSAFPAADIEALSRSPPKPAT